jgi:hypothetical protein
MGLFRFDKKLYFFFSTSELKKFRIVKFGHLIFLLPFLEPISKGDGVVQTKERNKRV